MSVLSSINDTFGLHSSALAGVLFAAVVVIVTTELMRSKRYQEKAPPLAPFGMLNTIRELTSDNMPWFLRKCVRVCGTYTFRLSLPIPGIPMFVVTGDAALAREVLMDPLTIKPKTYEEVQPMGVSSIFNRNGPFWHVRRKSQAPAFSPHHIKRMNRVAMDCTDKWIEDKLIPWAKEGKSFDVGKEMISVTLDAICKTAFEYEISEQEKKEFTQNCELVFREFFSRSTANPFRKIFGRLLPERRRALRAARSNHELAMSIVSNYRSLPNPTKGTLIDLIANQSFYKDDFELGADVVTYLVGGHDVRAFTTTAYSMAFTFLELARNPEEQRKLQKDLSSKEQTVEAWSRSEILHMAIKESMRLHPVSTIGSARQLGREFVTKEGWVLPKESIVTTSIGLLHHNSTVFGEHDKFRPSRWKDPTQEMKDSFLIFSAGKQNCIGQSLAKAELQCIIPKILSVVDLEVENQGTTEWFLTLKPVGAMLKPILRN